MLQHHGVPGRVVPDLRKSTNTGMSKVLPVISKPVENIGYQMFALELTSKRHADL